MISVQECGPAFLLVGLIAVIAWLCYNIHSISRAANALERIADELEREGEDDAE